MSKDQCASCAYEEEHDITVDGSKPNTEWAKLISVSETSIRRHRKHSQGTSAFRKGGDSAGSLYNEFPSDIEMGYEDFREYIRASGQDPDKVTFNWGVTSNPNGGYWNKLLNVKPIAEDAGQPKWPVIDQAAPVEIQWMPLPSKPARGGLLLSLKGADTQIGFRALPDGTHEEFHDADAMDTFVEVARIEQPDSIIILGDFLDLAGQGKYIQEAGFARTTQMSLDFAHEWLSVLRAAAPESKIVIIEGNHDKRMQNFIELNALAAFGLTRANMPDDWPVMSLPYLLRLDELDIEYMDAYPAAVYWDDDRTRNIHGTRANSKGSTTAQYTGDLPHINTWVGHTHRTEITYKTIMGARGEAIESYSANPGALCKVDGTVPSVHGALHANGTSAKVVEDWQNGFGINLYDPATGESWPQVYRIKDGKTIYNGRVIG